MPRHLGRSLPTLIAANALSWAGDLVFRIETELHMNDDNLLPTPTCAACYDPMAPVGGGWWCDHCQEFA